MTANVLSLDYSIKMSSAKAVIINETIQTGVGSVEFSTPTKKPEIKPIGKPGTEIEKML